MPKARAKTRHLRSRAAVEAVETDEASGSSDVNENRIVEKLFEKMRDSGLFPQAERPDGTFCSQLKTVSASHTPGQPDDVAVLESGASTSNGPEPAPPTVSSAGVSLQQFAESETMCTGPGLNTVSDSVRALTGLNAASVHVLASSLAKSTRLSYLKYWLQFRDYWYTQKRDPKLPVSTADLVNYLSSLLQSGYASSTIASHASAIAFTHKLHGFADPVDSFLVRKCLRGISKLKGSVDSRLPITKQILRQLLESIPITITAQQYRVLLPAIFLLAYNGFFRMGELCLKTSSDPSHVLQVADAQFVTENGKLCGLNITLHHYKHKKGSSPVVLHFSCRQAQFCPVLALYAYRQVFRHASGPLFQFQNGLPVTYSFVLEKMKLLVSFLGLDPTRYKPHSFRIGAASAALLEGHSEEAIRKMGRWSSDAVHNYIRLPVLQL